MDVSPKQDPKEHTGQIKEHIDHTVDHLRSGIHKVDDPKARALFETAAEVLLGLRKAFEDYEEGTEAAWR